VSSVQVNEIGRRNQSHRRDEQMSRETAVTPTARRNKTCLDCERVIPSRGMVLKMNRAYPSKSAPERWRYAQATTILQNAGHVPGIGLGLREWKGNRALVARILRLIAGARRLESRSGGVVRFW
jgi:hypothetical protein